MGATWHAVSAFARIQREILAKYPHDSVEDKLFLARGAQERDLLSYMFDNFLDAARRAHNAGIRSLRRGLHQPLPDSMHKLVQDLRNGKRSFPDALKSGF